MMELATTDTVDRNAELREGTLHREFRVQSASGSRANNTTAVGGTAR
jgi:hypothetical protein